jgi:hypothetical protein
VELLPLVDDQGIATLHAMFTSPPPSRRRAVPISRIPAASTLRLWFASPAPTDTTPDRMPKTTDTQTSRNAAVTCPGRSWPPEGG